MLKNKNTKKAKTTIIVLCTIIFYYFVGCLFKTDILNAITFGKHKISISFIGIFLLIVTVLLVSYIVDIISNQRDKDRKQ